MSHENKVTYLRKLHPEDSRGQRLNFSKGLANVTMLTVEGRCDPVQDCAPKVHPPDELEVVWRIRLTFDDVEYGLVQDRNRASDACDAEGLGTKDGENEGSHEGR